MVNFFIQAGSPKFIKDLNLTVYDLEESIEISFDDPTEYAFIAWNNTYISLSYKYDIADFCIDFLEMLLFLQTESSGNKTFIFASNDFHTCWNLVWSNHNLMIYADWVLLQGDIQSVASRCNILSVKIENFLSEWKMIFTNIINAIKYSDVKIEQTKEMELLLQVESNISEFGYLYRLS